MTLEYDNQSLTFKKQNRKLVTRVEDANSRLPESC